MLTRSGNKFLSQIVVTGVVAVLTQLTALSQKLTAPIPVEEVLRSWSFANRSTIDLSPDGQSVAYTLESQSRLEAVTDQRFAIFNRRGVSIDAIGRTVWITDTKSGASEQPIKAPHSSWGVSWSPDGRFLAFFSDRGGYAALWIWERSSRRVHQVTRLIARPTYGFDTPQWTSDSRRVLVKVMPEGMTIEDAANLLAPPPESERRKSELSSVVIYPKPKALPERAASEAQAFVRSEGIRNRTLADLALIDVATGRAQRLVRRCSTNVLLISPDGNRVAFTDFKGTIPGAQGGIGDITVVSLRDGTSRVVSGNVEYTTGRELSWSPDSRRLAYITTRYPGAGPVTTGDCFVVSIDTGSEPRKLTTGDHPNFGANYDYSRPLWDQTGENLYLIGNRNLWTVSIAGGPARQITHDLPSGVTEVVASLGTGRAWSPDEGSVYVRVGNSKTKTAGFYKITTNGQATKLLEREATFGSLNLKLDISEDQETVVYTVQDAQNYEDLWVAGKDFSAPRRISYINPQLDKYEMGRVRIVEWQTETGEQLRGALLLPSGYEPGKRYPTIVEVYGGDDGSAYANVFGMDEGGVTNKQLLATRGYAIFSPDIPMGVGSPMRDIARAVLPGVKKIIEMGIADPERLGVTGRSYGGYCTMALIVQTDVFKAAVNRSGKANLINSYGVMTPDGNALATTWAEVGQGRMGGTPWQYRDRYIENSPTFFLDRVKTPLLIIAGASDTGVPAFLTDEIFVALRRLGKEVVYAKYQGGGHTETSFNYADSLDYANRMIAWFDKYLKAPEKTAGRMQ